jgi:hypothetical protein
LSVPIPSYALVKPVLKLQYEVVGFTLVDLDDAVAASRHRWCLGSGGYARRKDRTTHKTLLLHRWLLGLHYGDPLQGDHIDRNKLNNTRVNLRIVSMPEQRQNRPSQKGSSSRYRGVAFYGGKWVARVHAGGKIHYAGFYTTEESAAFAASAARKKLFPLSNEEGLTPAPLMPGAPLEAPEPEGEPS